MAPITLSDDRPPAPSSVIDITNLHNADILVQHHRRQLVNPQGLIATFNTFYNLYYILLFRRYIQMRWSSGVQNRACEQSSTVECYQRRASRFGSGLCPKMPRNGKINKGSGFSKPSIY